MSPAIRLLCFVFLFDVASASITSAADSDEAKIARFRRDLEFVRELYTGKRFDALKKVYVARLRNRDVRSWQSAVDEARQKKQRSSFLAEYFAYAGETEIVPFDITNDLKREKSKWPLTTTKRRLQLFAFRPVKSKTDEPLSEKLKSTTYIIIRGKVPLEDNAYGVVLCQAVRGYTRQEIWRLVETYQKSW